MAREMKDSGVVWIGEIPADWDVLPLKRLCSMQAGKNLISEQIKLSGEYPVYGGNGLRGYFDEFNNDGEYLLVGRQGALCGNVHRVAGRFWATEHAIVTSTSPLVKADFLYYLLTAMDLNQYASDVAAQPGLSVNSILNVKTCSTSFAQQIRIAAFLDKKCAEIDAVLEKARTSIEEYKKLKQAIITQAVTKGVRGDRPMKESGIEWVPIVPDDWFVCKTLYCLNMPITDGPHITPEFYDEGIPFVSAEAVSCGNGLIDFSHIRGYVSAEFYAECCKKYVPRIDDIYMIKSGATTGKVAIVDTDRIFTIWSPLAVLRCNRSITLPKYMFYFLQSIPYQKQIELGWSYGTQQNIGMRTLERLKVCLPLLDEQKEIVEYLDDMISEIDLSIKKKEKMLSELESYKKSLIYEYVTGKKEV